MRSDLIDGVGIRNFPSRTRRGGVVSLEKHSLRPSTERVIPQPSRPARRFLDLAIVTLAECVGAVAGG